ncbi:PREDICTED: CDGSH iron-sulfur domain-containing protein 3, mitochondrial isoform X1 [Gavialis gangeticus]|uniref:CDGSH iron-sulfur domain-containing protein 3, mitochondrial isoform X1 n=1 Tax=Gavialis gangeticus TaxID=94835 RepID=UPI00092F469B|nr:PREDICTED: CDGSH iron-sulfur domain-containing protein 3, mitochondrial isoform X1 [Gavialis gangeticus]
MALHRPAALGTLMSGCGARTLRGQIRKSSESSMSPARPAIAAKHPYQVDLEAGKLYAWCACGHSKKQAGCTRYFKGRGPFCQEKGKKNSGGGSFGLSHYHGCQICMQAVWGSEMKLKRERQAEAVNDCQTFQCHLSLGKLP